MKQRTAALIGLLMAAGAIAAERAEPSAQTRQAMSRVVEAIESKDCAQAVQLLNNGLAEKSASMYLLAGTLYEEGLCLKANWDRALQMYLRAMEAGHPGGQFKLVSGYAHRHRDPAAALWWAHREPVLKLPADCRVAAPAAADPDAFVQALQAWPAGRLAACTYTAGVLATVAADAIYPVDALGYGLTGQVDMHFVPAAGRIEWKTLDVDEVALIGVVSGATLRERITPRAQRSLQTYLEGAGERALQRYPRPTDIDPSWQVKVHYVFKIR